MLCAHCGKAESEWQILEGTPAERGVCTTCLRTHYHGSLEEFRRAAMGWGLPTDTRSVDPVGMPALVSLSIQEVDHHQMLKVTTAEAYEVVE